MEKYIYFFIHIYIWSKLAKHLFGFYIHICIYIFAQYRYFFTSEIETLNLSFTFLFTFFNFRSVMDELKVTFIRYFLDLTTIIEMCAKRRIVKHSSINSWKLKNVKKKEYKFRYQILAAFIKVFFSFWHIFIWKSYSYIFLNTPSLFIVIDPYFCH